MMYIQVIHMKKDAIQFLHDAGAFNSFKHIGLRTEFKAEGYGIFWMIIETLRLEKNYRIELSKIDRLKTSLKPYSDKFDFESFFKFCFDEGLLSKDNTYLWSDSLLRRMEAFNKARDKMSKGGKKARLMDKLKEDSSTIQPPLKEDININTNKKEMQIEVETQNQIEKMAGEILLKFNESTGKKYRDIDKVIEYRLREGYKKNQLIELIERKKHDTNFVKKGFMTVDILFGGKIERYINETVEELKDRQKSYGSNISQSSQSLPKMENISHLSREQQKDYHAGKIDAQGNPMESK